MAKNIYIGVDVGGTKILSCPLQLTKKYKILGRAKSRTMKNGGPENLVDDIVKTIRKSAEEADLSLSDVAGVGVGIPGAVNVDRGEVILAPNLDWENIPIKKILQKKLGLPVFAANDVNLGTLAEQQFGAAAGLKNVVGVFWGTGIGGGLVVEGRVHHGFTYTAGEVGHLPVIGADMACSCGNKGCLEAVAGKWALSRDWNLYQAKNEKTESPNGRILKSKLIRNRYREGHKFFVKAVDQAVRYVGSSLAQIVNLLNPEMIVLGGGMIEAMDELMPKIYSGMKPHLFPHADIELKAAQLGDYAVLTGAAAFARQSIR